jgi:hypothetical protein
MMFTAGLATNQSTGQAIGKPPSVVTLKPANGGRGKTGQREWPGLCCFTLPNPVSASLILCANCAGRI